MAMTWAELKAELVDLGFEEDDTVNNEYGRIMRNAVNRAQNFIYYSVEDRLKDYYAIEESFGYDDDGEWVLPKPKKVTADTEDDARINLADNLVELLPLLAAHYIWLDDDITKATMYFNEFDQMKNEIMSNCLRPRKATIEGGIRW